MAPPRRTPKPAAALRPKRAALFVILAVVGLWVGAQLARLEQDTPPVQRATPAVAWENGSVVIRVPAEQTAEVPDP